MQALNDADKETVDKAVAAIGAKYSITELTLRDIVWYVAEHELNLVGKEVSEAKGLQAFATLIGLDSVNLIGLGSNGYIPYTDLVALCTVLGITLKSVLFATWAFTYSDALQTMVGRNELLQELQALNDADKETVYKAETLINDKYTTSVFNLRYVVWYVVEHQLNLVGTKVAVEKGLQAFSILVDFDSDVLLEVCSNGHIAYNDLIDLCYLLGIKKGYNNSR